ncbi:C2H2-type domain-containing protein [Heracleum sosnowskyi]|uniref:C2H2-type domain-containing protein n=1 Tax=Heracleum sosnowskyi TaxID=360622 RepID=A0AAD8H9M1_9APIA|nr:C2H2-type domain-containing protein [Heracleum sosnowskyi]
MALLTFQETSSQSNKQKQPSSSSKRKKKQIKQQQQPSSWDQIKNLLTCKQLEGSKVHDPSSSKKIDKNLSSGYSKLGSCSSICTFRDVAHGNTSRVVHRADNSPDSSSVGQETGLIRRKTMNSSSSTRSHMTSTATSVRSNGGGSCRSSSRGMQFRKLSGCYECHVAHMIVDPSRYPTPRSTICACPECGEVFPKIESLEHHQAVRHAVSELGPEDSGRNIVEIIFKSSWLKKDSPICIIERILKVHNTKRTIQKFEDCRDAVKFRANTNTKRDPRCAADGNELLRFHCTSLTCSLGAHGSSSLCGSVPGCAVCTVIRHGFQGRELAAGADNQGVRTTASSGRAHDCLDSTDTRRAMLVCRVIAGRVKRSEDDVASEEGNAAAVNGSGSAYDSVAGLGGVFSNLEELHVANPRAILPCFVVIYKTSI